MREMKQTMAAVLSLALACTLLIAPAEGPAAKKKMKLNKTKATLYVGKKLTLKVKNTKKKVKWSSSKKAVASVTKKGVVKAKKKGKTVITAKIGKKKLKCKITVKQKVVKKKTSSQYWIPRVLKTFLEQSESLQYKPQENELLMARYRFDGICKCSRKCPNNHCTLNA